MNINLSIESIDLHGEISMEEVSGTKKIIEEKIHYSYPSGMGHCDFYITSQELHMKRYGEGEMDLIFNGDSGIGTMDYTTMNLSKKFLIKNGKIEIYSGLIVFSYDIFDEESLMNSLTIKISEE